MLCKQCPERFHDLHGAREKAFRCQPRISRNMPAKQEQQPGYTPQYQAFYASGREAAIQLRKFKPAS